MATQLTVRTARGHLDTFHGDTIGWLIVNADGADAAATSMHFVSEVVADELAGAGYARGVMDVVYEQIGENGYLQRDPIFPVPSTDTSDSDDPAGVWFYDPTGGSDATNELIAFLPVPVGAGTAGWDVDPADGIAVVSIADGDGSATLAGLTDVDVTSTPPDNLNSLMFNESTGKWEPGIPAGSGSLASAVVDAVLAADAIDGTGDQFSLLAYNPDATATGILPADWDALPGYTDMSEATLAPLVGFLGDATLLVYTDGAWSVRSLTEATIDDPWTEVTADLVFGSVVGLLADEVFTPASAEGIPYYGTGLLDGATNVSYAINNLEGSLDRWFFAAAVGTTNKNLAALGAASWEYGDTRFTRETTTTPEALDYCFVWLFGQTDPDENGPYQVNDDFTYAAIDHPDVFDPRGQGFRLTLQAPGDPANGTTWQFIADNPSDRVRATGNTDTTQVGEWVLIIDPTATGGGVADEINDGTTTIAPSQNAVFDALAAKAPLASPAFTGTPTGITAAHVNAVPSTVSRHAWLTGSLTAILQGSATTLTMTTDRLYIGVTLDLPVARTIDRVYFRHDSGVPTTVTFSGGAWAPTATGGIPGARIHDFGTNTTTAATGLKFLGGTGPWVIPAGRTYFGIVAQFTGTAPVLSSISNGFPVSYPTATGDPNQAPIQTGVSGSLPDPAVPNNTSNVMPNIFLRLA